MRYEIWICKNFTIGQDLQAQISVLENEGCGVIYQDKYTDLKWTEKNLINYWM